MLVSSIMVTRLLGNEYKKTFVSLSQNRVDKEEEKNTANCKAFTQTQ